MRGPVEGAPARRRPPSRRPDRARARARPPPEPLVRSWGSRRRRAATGARSPAGRPAPRVGSELDVVVGADRAEGDVTSQARRRGAPSPRGRGRTRSPHRRGAGAPRSGLGVDVAVHRAVPVEVVRSEVEPHRGLAAERSRPRQAGSWCTRRRMRRTSMSRAVTSGISVLPAATGARRGVEHVDRPATSWWSCRRCRSPPASGAVHPARSCSHS